MLGFNIYFYSSIQIFSHKASVNKLTPKYNFKSAMIDQENVSAVISDILMHKVKETECNKIVDLLHARC